MTDPIKNYSEELKREIVEELERGEVSLREAAERSHTTVTRVKQWIEEYGKYKPKRDIVEVVMKREEERIATLEKALAEAHLKIRVQEEILLLASKKYRVDLKKTFGEQRLIESEGKAKRASKNLAKR